MIVPQSTPGRNAGVQRTFTRCPVTANLELVPSTFERAS